MASPIIKGAQSEGKLTVMFDSGIRTGSDVIKALALGAQAVLRTCVTLHCTHRLTLDFLSSPAVGRPYVYGLALAGEDGVEAVIRSLLCDLEATLGIMGCTCIQDVQGKKDKILRREA